MTHVYTNYVYRNSNRVICFRTQDVSAFHFFLLKSVLDFKYLNWSLVTS